LIAARCFFALRRLGLSLFILRKSVSKKIVFLLQKLSFVLYYTADTVKRALSALGRKRALNGSIHITVRMTPRGFGLSWN